ncbi:MAG: VWA domain-containing protein [Acidimicrobiales bacterium]|nr:VWA domain-containing protein [Acidimicrobiales bacterium]MDG1845278.1 VWA domain-containing protein [Acidimicrobiales bacterium]
MSVETRKKPTEVPELLTVGFVTLLRSLGLTIPIGSVIAFQESLRELGLENRKSVYWAGRTTLITDPENISLYDQAFIGFWEGQAFIEQDLSPLIQTVTLAIDDGPSLDETANDEERPEGEVINLRYSTSEVLQQKDFALYNLRELEEAHVLMQAMLLIGGSRSSRRKLPSGKKTQYPDLRRTIRRSLRTNGEPIRQDFLERGKRLRRVVFLLDISGSMETYARALVRFVQAAVVGRRQVEVFTLGTRLTRITRELSSRDLDRAIDAAANSVQDWSGGTRLGETLRIFNNDWGQRGIARGASVVILSDGWDRGDASIMSEEMGRLQKVSHQIVWVNPLKASPGYEPLAQGMAAALPYVDRFIEGHNMESLTNLAALLSE